MYRSTMIGQRPTDTPRSIDQVRHLARVLVIDDHAFTYQRLFTRDGYKIERWAEIKNLHQLTDGDFHLILLDIQGVGLAESRAKQGFGILEHIKQTNPAQPVVVYSSKPYSIRDTRYIRLADGFLDKESDYVEFKSIVDKLIVAQTSPGYFIARMNEQLGETAASVPKAVPLALRAVQSGNPQRLKRYLDKYVPDTQKVDIALKVVSVGISVLGALSS
ncbi:response regulator transcription factor [Schumannella soli]|uniref:Response regulator n=1 Tax=Schumannella soli TaxID=2590779 RepID=A0A506XXX2_9MICO|nr:response regulator transcription factor [Schumannella soli]TPW74635.1 response regulator [Schumannella soli]